MLKRHAAGRFIGIRRQAVNILNLFVTSLVGLLNPMCLLLMVAGVAVGIVFGSIPGLSASMAVAVFLPMTFAMQSHEAFILLIALYIGGISGGLISAILLNIPGTPSSIATCFDGGPMKKNGEAAKALGTGVVFSFIGGLISFMILLFVAPSLAKVTLQFSAVEYFGVCVFALSMIAALSGNNMTKGLLAGCLGLAVSCVGIAPVDGVKRFTLGITDLNGGFDTLPTLIGIFAVAEVLSIAEEVTKMSKATHVEQNFKIKGFGFTWKEFVGQKWNALRSALIGTGIGILPGIGGSTAGILSYVAAKKSSKYPEKFGTGIIDGIVASETSNNAVIGGALIPLLTLGIPGDGVTAVLLGAFVIHGLTPGPLLFTNSASLVYTIFAACVVANIIMLILELVGMRVFVRLLSIPNNILLPIVLVMSVVGAFATNNRVFDTQAIIFFGLIGYFMRKFKMPSAPFILSFILGDMLETNLRRGLMLTKGSFGAFFTHPVSAVFMILAVMFIAWTVYKQMRDRRLGKSMGDEIAD